MIESPEDPLKSLQSSVFHQPSKNYRNKERSKDYFITTSVPRQVGQRGEADDEVEDGPAHDDAVVDIEEGHQHHGGRPRAPEQGTQPPHQGHPTLTQILTNSHL